MLTVADCWGGAEIHTVALCRTLAARGAEVTIVQLGHDVYERGALNGCANIRLARVSAPRPLSDLTVLDWVRLFRKWKGTACLQPKGTFETVSTQFDLAARLSFKTFTTIEHLACPPMPPKSSRRYLGGLVPGLGAWWYRILFPRYLRSLGPRRIICVSETVRTRLAQHCAFPLRKMVTVHNGIDSRVFRPSAESRRRIRDTWGIAQNALIFGSVGRFNVQKAHHLALAAFKQLVCKHPEQDLRWVLVGEGPLEQELVNIVRDAGLGERAQILGFTDRPWEVYSGLDFFVLSSVNEGLPLALLEAMACGCSPIATRVGGVPEVLDDRSLGWLVEPNDVPDLVSAMEAAALTLPEVRVQMGRRARGHVVTRFDADTQYSRLADVLQQEWKL